MSQNLSIFLKCKRKIFPARFSPKSSECHPSSILSHHPTSFKIPFAPKNFSPLLFGKFSFPKQPEILKSARLLITQLILNLTSVNFSHVNLFSLPMIFFLILLSKFSCRPLGFGSCLFHVESIQLPALRQSSTQSPGQELSAYPATRNPGFHINHNQNSPWTLSPPQVPHSHLQLVNLPTSLLQLLLPTNPTLINLFQSHSLSLPTLTPSSKHIHLIYQRIQSHFSHLSPLSFAESDQSPFHNPNLIPPVGPSKSPTPPPCHKCQLKSSRKGERLKRQDFIFLQMALEKPPHLPSRKTYLQSPSSRTFNHTPHQHSRSQRLRPSLLRIQPLQTTTHFNKLHQSVSKSTTSRHLKARTSSNPVNLKNSPARNFPQFWSSCEPAQKPQITNRRLIKNPQESHPWMAVSGLTPGHFYGPHSTRNTTLWSLNCKGSPADISLHSKIYISPKILTRLSHLQPLLSTSSKSRISWNLPERLGNPHLLYIPTVRPFLQKSLNQLKPVYSPSFHLISTRSNISTSPFLSQIQHSALAASCILPQKPHTILMKPGNIVSQSFPTLENPVTSPELSKLFSISNNHLAAVPCQEPRTGFLSSTHFGLCLPPPRFHGNSTKKGLISPDMKPFKISVLSSLKLKPTLSPGNNGGPKK